MTIFDSLKYSVGENPTEADLEKIPREILEKWVNRYDGPHHIGHLPQERLIRDLRHEILIHNETFRERWKRWYWDFLNLFKKK